MTDNELIAEFMGLPLTKKVVAFTGGMRTEPFQRWKYHESWDWLMPVLEKIQALGYDYTVKGIGKEDTIVTIYCDTYTSNRKKVSMVAIEAYYQSVVEFIKWYNQKK